MLTQAPLPSWLELARSIVAPKASGADLTGKWCGDGDVGGWLSRSSWSLALIGIWRSKTVGKRAPIVWLPDFFCNDALSPLRQTGASLRFYPVTEALEANLEVCRSMCAAEAPDVVVVVHYFGRPAAHTEALRDLCKSCGAWLVEDAAHVLRPIDGVGSNGDFVLFSPHKLLAMPQGAVLVVRAGGPAEFGTVAAVPGFGYPPTWPDQLRDLYRQRHPSNSKRPPSAVWWTAKRLLQRLGFRRFGGGSVKFSEEIQRDPAPLPALPPPRVSLYALNLARELLRDFPSVARRRQRHLLIWDALVVGSLAGDSAGVSAAERPVGREWTPYLAAFNLGTADGSGIFENWRQQELPVTTWPDLPPEVIRAREHHSIAWQLRHSRLYLPVQQSLRVRDILAQFRTTEARFGSAAAISLEWGSFDSAQWRRWIVAAGDSNLLQTWAYGEAKAATAGWTVTRGVFRARGEAVAIVQVLTKRIGGVVTLARVNRGPLELRVLSPDERVGVYRQLGRVGNAARARLLSIAPELKLSGENLLLLEELGFSQFATTATESATLDLRLDADVLRSNLRGSWRKWCKEIESPARKGITVEITNGRDAFDWMMSRYSDLMKSMHFQGAPVDLMWRLRERATGDEPLFVARALFEGEAISGICVAPHGLAATYLIGWNGPKGRKLPASQALLWATVKHLKIGGFHWFDLGGIDEGKTPGIAAFKLGMGGQRYELVGEYWRW